MLSTTQTVRAVVSAKAKFASHGNTVSCDNTLVFVARTEKGGIAVIQSIPVIGTSMVVFPIKREHRMKLTPCAALPCLASMLHGIINPSDFVKYTEKMIYSGPIYRSLAGSADEEQGCSQKRKHVEIPALKVFHNPDGGIVASVPVKEFVSRNMTPEQRALLASPMLKCITEGLKEARIDPCRVFGDEYDPDDPMTTWCAIPFLLDAITPDCDIMIGIMPPGKNEGRFTFCYYDEDDLGTVPILGLVHSDHPPMQYVEDIIYVATNDPSIQLTFSKDLPYDGEDEKYLGSSVTIVPQPSEVYIKDHYAIEDSIARSAAFNDISADEGDYPDDYGRNGHADYSRAFKGRRGHDTHGNYVWADAQRDFQASLIDAVDGVVDEFLFATIGARMNVVDILCESNIKGMRLPRNAVEAALTIDARVANSPSAMARGMAIYKRLVSV